MTLLGLRLRGRQTVEEDVRPEPESQPGGHSAPSGPPLVLLAPTVAGVGSFHFLSFSDAESAARYAEENFNAFQRSNIYAFWALQQKPESPPTEREHRGEVLVLIREAAGSDIVYAVSFVDFGAADSFVRFEAGRGLELGLVSIYWALLVGVEETEASVRLTPGAPPVSERRAERARASHRPKPVSERQQTRHDTTAREVDGLRGEVRAEVEAVLEAYQNAHSNAEPATIGEAQEPPHEAWGEQALPPDPALAGDEELMDRAATVGPEEPASQFVSGLAEVSEEQTSGWAGSRAVEHPEAGWPGVVEAGLDGSAQPVAPQDEALPAVQAAAHSAPEPGDGDNDFGAGGEHAEAVDLFDVALEAAKTLRPRRWERREEPFQGFNSPPGRF